MPQSSPSLPVQSLPHFLDEVTKLFDNMVDSWSQILFAESQRAPIADAWAELKPGIDAVKSELSLSTTKDPLKQAGLTGKQLALKLKGLNDAWTRFVQRGTIRLLKKLLDWINALLESLASAIPGGEAIKEFKEAMENSMDEDD